MRITIVLTLIIFLLSCNNNSDSLHAKQVSDVKDSVQQMTASIAKDVSRDGPVAWLRYFENTPNFFMASEGQLVFQNYDSANNFINHVLVKNIRKIELHWRNTRIDPLTYTLASIAAMFHEDITNSAGIKIPMDGYFTGIAQHTSGGWKLLSVHWSVTTKH